jgi:hypothetical protein
MTSFDQLKQICTTACHDRHACAEGYCAMLATKNISQLMAVWRANWEDLVESKYADIINEQLHALYLDPTLRAEMNAAGIYVNECPKTAPEFVLVIVTDHDRIVDIYDYAKCYVLGRAYVRAWDHAQVYSEKNDECLVQLYDHSYGHVSKGGVEATGYSRLWTSTNARLFGRVTCEAHGGELRVCGYLKIEAYGDTKVFSNTDRNITLYGNAHIIV